MTGTGSTERAPARSNRRVDARRAWRRCGETEGHVMSLDEQLAEILARLGVLLEDDTEPVWPVASEVEDDEPEVRRMASGHEHDMAPGAVVPLRFQAGDELAASIEATADMSLFQTSREHYGVFYRL